MDNFPDVQKLVTYSTIVNFKGVELLCTLDKVLPVVPVISCLFSIQFHELPNGRVFWATCFYFISTNSCTHTAPGSENPPPRRANLIFSHQPEKLLQLIMALFSCTAWYRICCWGVLIFDKYLWKQAIVYMKIPFPVVKNKIQNGK